MKASLGNRRQLITLVIALGVFAALFIRWRSAPSESPAVSTAAQSTGDGSEAADRPARPRARSASGERTPSIDEIPMVNKRDFDNPAPRLGQSSRNPFDPRLPTPTPPPPPPPTPTPIPRPGDPRYIGPLPLPTAPPPTPTPQPPPIPFKFIGTFGPKNHPFAVLVLNDQIVNAREGEVVFDQFIIARIGYESIDVGFKGRARDDIRRMAITQ